MSVAAPAPAISLVTSCKGRLSSLKQSLPRMVAQAHAEIIVVDYDCPQGSGAWVAAEYPAVRVVQIAGEPVFNVARARNLGAQAARAQWLFFVDADVMLDEHFVEQVLPRLRMGAFYSMANSHPGTVGTVICRREDFVALEGYDEVLQGWGTEDRDFYIRLAMRGCAHEVLPAAGIRAIEHDDDARVYYYEIKDRWLSQRINASYVQIKHDLARQFDSLQLPLAVRREVYAQVRQAFTCSAAAEPGAARIQITLPAELAVRFYGWRMKRIWTYEVEPVQQAAGGASVLNPARAAV